MRSAKLLYILTAFCCFTASAAENPFSISSSIAPGPSRQNPFSSSAKYSTQLLPPVPPPAQPSSTPSAVIRSSKPTLSRVIKHAGCSVEFKEKSVEAPGVGGTVRVSLQFTGGNSCKKSGLTSDEWVLIERFTQEGVDLVLLENESAKSRSSQVTISPGSTGDVLNLTINQAAGLHQPLIQGSL